MAFIIQRTGTNISMTIPVVTISQPGCDLLPKELFPFTKNLLKTSISGSRGTKYYIKRLYYSGNRKYINLLKFVNMRGSECEKGGKCENVKINTAFARGVLHISTFSNFQALTRIPLF